MSRLRLLAFLVLAFAVAMPAPPAFAQRQQRQAAQQAQQAFPEEVQAAVTQFGGLYQDAELQRYVESIGRLLVSTTETPNDPFTFGLLDSDIVNAFSMPGGYVFVTRGLLALANNEAELASVIGHEIGHVTARHASSRQTRGVIAQLGAGLLGALLGNPNIANAAGMGAQLYLQKYSRDQEFEADQRGVGYMARVGYDTRAAPAFLASLEAWMQLEGKVAGHAMGDAAYNMLADHPRTVDRVERARELAMSNQPKNAMVERQIYQKKIDGLIFGDDPKQGVVRDRLFIHPALRFAFEVPQGFHISNTPSQVHAEGPGGAAIVFDQSPRPFQGPPDEYIARAWASNLRLDSIERISVNGMDAATAATRAQTQDGQVADIRLVAIRFDASTYYRFLFVSPPNVTARVSDAFRRTTYSFRRLGEKEVEGIRPMRIRTVTARPGDTVDTLSARMPFAELRRERFMVLNGLDQPSQLAPGEMFKVVTQ
jgi:predicted Zn-dependent protease